MDSAVVEGFATCEFKPGRTRTVGEESLAASERQGEQEQVQLVDQVVGEHRPHQGAAAAHVDTAVDACLEAADRIGAVGPEDGRVAQSALPSVDETTYLGVSFMNGAPGSSAAVLVDHVGANSS